MHPSEPSLDATEWHVRPPLRGNKNSRGRTTQHFPNETILDDMLYYHTTQSHIHRFPKTSANRHATSFASIHNIPVHTGTPEDQKNTLKLIHIQEESNTISKDVVNRVLGTRLSPIDRTEALLLRETRILLAQLRSGSFKIISGAHR